MQGGIGSIGRDVTEEARVRRALLRHPLHGLFEVNVGAVALVTPLDALVHEHRGGFESVAVAEQ